ncbi:MAG: ATP-binding protein [bacterium]
MNKLALLIFFGLASSFQGLGATPVRVGVCIQPPLTIQKSPGKPPQGFFIDILNDIAKRNNWVLSYTVDSRANLIAKLTRQEIDLVMPAAFPLNGPDNLDYTSSFITSYASLYVPQNTLFPSYHELQGKTLALVNEDVYSNHFLDYLKAMGIRCELIAMRSYEEVFAALAAGRVDAGLTDHFFGDLNYQQYDLAPTPTVSAPSDFRCAVYHDRNWPLRQTIDRELISLKNNPRSVYFTALEQWTGYHAPPSYMDNFWLIGFGLLCAGGLIVTVVFLIRKSIRAQIGKLAAANRQLLKGTEDLLSNEAAANELKTWYRTLLNHTPDIILIHGVDTKGLPGKFFDANATACARLGYSRQELLSLYPKQIEVHPDSSTTPRYATLLSAWRDARLPDASGEEKKTVSLTVESTYRTKNGQEFPAEASIHILEHGGQPVVYYAIHDITKRKKARQALQDRERRFSDFFASAPIGIALFDSSQRLTDVNQAALAMFGFSERSHFAEAKLFDLHALEEQKLQTLMKGGTIRFETVVDFDLLRHEQRNPSARTGKCSFDILITNLGLDEDFNPKGFMFQIQDITDHRRAEDALRQNEKVLRQAQKMEAIGTLAGGIAHDFNNILTPIIGYTEMAMMTLAPADPILNNLDEVLKASNRAKELVKQILTFSRQTEHEVKPIRIIPLVKEVSQLLRGSILPSIELLLNLQTERDIVKADPTQMHQVIMNLCTNAIHAMKDKGGTLEISIKQLSVDSRTHGPLARLRFGTYVEIAVRDSGHGMDRTVMERIFEPFFTTKRSGEGTGMGLAVVHGIVASLQGTITVESEIGKGTTFHVVLPLLEQASDQADTKATEIPRGSERILFVDDELGITTMASQMLTSLGYKVVTSMRPYDALTLFREDPSRFDLIITDQIMPGLNGMDLIHEIHAIRPNIPSLICTGFSRNVDDRDLLQAGVQEVLMKPLVLRQLAQAIRRALEPVKARPPAGPPSDALPPKQSARSPQDV